MTQNDFFLYMKADHYEKWSQIELFDYVSRLSIHLLF